MENKRRNRNFFDVTSGRRSPGGLTHGTSGDQVAEEMGIWMNEVSFLAVLQDTSAGNLCSLHCFTGKKHTSRECSWKKKKPSWDKVILACALKTGEINVEFSAKIVVD